MDAGVMVNYSRAWHTVPEQVKCEIAKPTGYRYEGLFTCMCRGSNLSLV